MSSKKTDATDTAATPAVAPKLPAKAKPQAQAWRVLRPVRHGTLDANGQRASRTWQSGELIELTDAQAAPLLARGAIERAPAAAPTNKD
ncbi:MAG: hypothetical protein Q4F13_06855 [Pseudomonadota bacterium]|nr:hypothetical protein [Pseudomonadota bacterium]